jgi:hypothetical protein
MELIFIGQQGLPTSLQGVDNDKTRARGHLEKILKESPGSIYKIGITSDPPKRSGNHREAIVSRREVEDMVYLTIQKGLWNRMFVIFQSPIQDVVSRAEKEFIAHAAKLYPDHDFQTHGLVSMNTSSGGGGSMGGEGPFYLYLLRSTG